MSLTKSISVLTVAMICATALFVSSCDDTTTTPAAFIPSAPSGLKALSVNDSTLRIMFTASASESNTAFKDYLLTAKSGSSTVTFTIPKGAGSPSWVELKPLASGATWNLSLVARSTDSSSSATTTSWATAMRYVGLKAYDKTSALGSGINLVNGTQQTVAAGGSWDLCFDSDNDAFGSPSVSGYVKNGQIGGSTPRKTYIFFTDANNAYYVTADSLNAVYETKALNDTSSSRKLRVESELDVKGAAKSYVIYCLTQDNNFAKILIKSVGGSAIQSDANGKYVQIDASVQRTANVPYAMRANFGFDGPTLKSNKIIHVNAN